MPESWVSSFWNETYTLAVMWYGNFRASLSKLILFSANLSNQTPPLLLYHSLSLRLSPSISTLVIQAEGIWHKSFVKLR